MDKETVKRLAAEHGVVPAYMGNSVALESFAQACCDWQREKDAHICEVVQADSASVLGADIEYKTGREMAACVCALSIRNTKPSPETDLDQAQRLR
jgi:hypothetical protein